MEVTLKRSRIQIVKYLLLSSLFVAMGVWELTSEDISPWIGWVTISFFGLGLFIGIYQLFDGKPAIIVNEHGIYDRSTHDSFINWELILDAYPIEISGVKFIGLIVSEDFKPSNEKGNIYRSLAKFSESLGAQEINIKLDSINVDQNRLTEFILATRSATREERILLLKNCEFGQ